MGKTTAIMGCQWGDEGKGKIVDILAEKADIIARATGGNNAGHTVVVGKDKFKFHLLPSGIIHQDKLSVCGNGMVIYPPQIIKEITELESKGYKITDKNLVISASSHVITEKQVEHDKKTGKKVGTTGRGIGPCYMAKIERTGLRMSEFVKKSSDEAKKLKPFVRDTYSIINKAIDDNKNILIEGAQGTMLDIDHGTYPYVTSSNPSAGGICTGLGIGPTKIDSVNGIVKAYVTRVGGGPFVTEIKGKEGEYLQDKGGEVGTTTGRTRRCGWFDAVIGKYAATVNGLDSIIITKLDVLSGLKKLKICIAYEYNGKKVEDFPTDITAFEKCKPVYIEMDGWDEDITKVRKYKELPDNAKKYLDRIKELLDVEISMVSVGPEREEVIVVKDIF